MMANEKVSDAQPVVDYANPTPAQQIRDLLARADLSQRQGARVLDVDERTVRYWCSGQRDVPKLAILALERLANMGREVREDPLASRWSRDVYKQQQLVEFLQSDNAVDAGHGKEAGTRPGLSAEVRLYLARIEQLQRMIDVRIKRLEGVSIPQPEGERDVLDRLDDTFQRRSIALREMRCRFLPYADGVLREDTMDDFDALDKEWREVHAEADRIVEEIRSGKRR